MSKRLGLSSRVHLLGYRGDIVDLYKVADLYVHPSLREGLSVALMEAMACGLPVVCSRIRGNTDLINDGEGGFLCTPDMVNEYKEAMNKILIDGLCAESMGKVNSNRIKNYDSSKIREMNRRIYESNLMRNMLNEKA